MDKNYESMSRDELDEEINDLAKSINVLKNNMEMLFFICTSQKIPLPLIANEEICNRLPFERISKFKTESKMLKFLSWLIMPLILFFPSFWLSYGLLTTIIIIAILFYMAVKVSEYHDKSKTPSEWVIDGCNRDYGLFWSGLVDGLIKLDQPKLEKITIDFASKNEKAK